MAAARAHAVSTASILLFTALTSLIAASDRPSISADEVLKKNIEATGGESAIRKLRTLAVIRELKIGERTGDINRPPTTGALATFRKAPDKYLVVRRIEGHEYRAGFDGTEGWEQVDGGKPRLLKDEELDEMKKSADFYATLNVAKWFQRVSYDKFDDSGKQPAHLLKFVSLHGATCYRYFDAKTFLEIKSSCAAPLGFAGGVFVSYLDYKRVEGVMIPYRTEGETNAHWAGGYEMGGGYVRSQVQDVQVNGKIDDSVFSRPQFPAKQK